MEKLLSNVSDVVALDIVFSRFFVLYKHMCNAKCRYFIDDANYVLQETFIIC